MAEDSDARIVRLACFHLRALWDRRETLILILIDLEKKESMALRPSRIVGFGNDYYI